MLVLLPFEAKLVSGLRRKRIAEDALLQSNADSVSEEVNAMMVPVRDRIRSGDVKLNSSAESAYRAFLAYYIARIDTLGGSLEEIVQSANQFAQSVGLLNSPKVSEKVAKKLDLVDVKGISIDHDPA